MSAMNERKHEPTDAGLGTLPWLPQRGYGLGVVDSDGFGVVRVHDAARDPEAVLRASLAVPDAIALARAVASINHPGYANLKALAAKVLAIVDGKEERS